MNPPSANPRGTYATLLLVYVTPIPGKVSETLGVFYSLDKKMVDSIRDVRACW